MNKQKKKTETTEKSKLLNLALPCIRWAFTSGPSLGKVDAVEKGRALFLRPRNLVGGHARLEFVFVLAGQLISLLDGKVQPGIGEHVILRHARAVGVHARWPADKPDEDE